MQEQPFKRLFFFAKTDSCEIQIKNRQQRRPGSKTSSCAGPDQKPADVQFQTQNRHFVRKMCCPSAFGPDPGDEW
jgi:hypothetical protein